jgi:hypothetical protein
MRTRPNHIATGKCEVALLFAFLRARLGATQAGCWTLSDMRRFGALVVGLFLTSGCEMVCVVPPATGRVVDARSQQPVPQAEVIRVHVEAPATTKTDAKGYFRFRGKRHLQVALGDPVLSPATYRVEVASYQSIETNRLHGIWANQSGLTDDFGTLQIVPK